VRRVIGAGGGNCTFERALELTASIRMPPPLGRCSPGSAQEPARYRAIGQTLFCKDWLRFRLTGDLATDPTEASVSFTDVRSQA
jgi:L-xylulokinase